MDERATAARPRTPEAQIPVLCLADEADDIAIGAGLAGRVGAR